MDRQEPHPKLGLKRTGAEIDRITTTFIESRLPPFPPQLYISRSVHLQSDPRFRVLHNLLQPFPCILDRLPSLDNGSQPTATKDRQNY